MPLGNTWSSVALTSQCLCLALWWISLAILCPGRLERRFMIQNYAKKNKLKEEEYRGERFANWSCNTKGDSDHLSITQPHIIKGIYKEYLEVGGSDLIGTNTFSSTTIAMTDYEMEDYVYELNYAGAHLAREACDDGALRNNSTFAATSAVCSCFNSISSALI